MTNEIYVLNSGSSNVTVVAEEQVQAIPLTTTIAPFPGGVTTSTTPTFNFTAASAFSPNAPAVENVYFQLDSGQGPWTAATSSGGGNFTGMAPSALPLGTHIVYAYATDGQEATSTLTGLQSSPLISNIVAQVFTVSLQAFAPAVTLSRASLAFANTPVSSSSASMPVMLTNSGIAPLNIATGGIGFTGTNPGDFSETDNCPTGTTALAPGVSCTINVTFTPSATSTRSASLSITDNAAGSPQTVSVVGIGTAAGTCGSNTWTGPTVGGQWATAGNWSTTAIPVSTDDVCISAGNSVSVAALLAANQTINSLNVQGSATLTFSGGPLTVTSVATLSNLSVTGGTITFSGNTAINASLLISSGTANFNGPATASTATLSGGTLGGTGTLTFNGVFNWTGGTTAGGGITQIAATGAMNINGTTLFLDGRTINNAGTTTWLGATFLRADAGNTVINNQSGGNFNAQNSSRMFINGGAPTITFNNLAGATLTKSGAGTTSTIQTVAFFNNTGAVSVLSVGDGTSGGTFTMAAGGTLDFNGGTQNLTAASSVSGAGDVSFSGNGAIVNVAGAYNNTGNTNISGATANFNATSTTGGGTQSAGTLGGTGTLTFNGVLNWTGGTTAGGGTTQIAASGAMNINGTTLFLDGRTINNAGTTTWLGTTDLRADAGNTVINNQSGGNFNAQNDSPMFNNGGAITFNNLAGATLTKSGGERRPR